MKICAWWQGLMDFTVRQCWQGEEQWRFRVLGKPSPFFQKALFNSGCPRRTMGSGEPVLRSCLASSGSTSVSCRLEKNSVPNSTSQDISVGRGEFRALHHGRFEDKKQFPAYLKCRLNCSKPSSCWHTRERKVPSVSF